MKKLLLPAFLLCTATTWTMSASLYNQSVAEVLRRQFTSPSLSYLLMDAPTGRLLVARWQDPDRPVPIGSLVKPFAALAYAQLRRFNPGFVPFTFQSRTQDDASDLPPKENP